MDTFITAYDIWQNVIPVSFENEVKEERHNILQTGCNSLDSLLQGGFQDGQLSEICGVAGAGKTQICLQLLLQTTLPRTFGGLDSKAFYICTEGIGSIKRLHDLACVYADKYQHLFPIQRQKTSKRKREEIFLERIYIEKLYESEDLVEIIQSRLPSLLSEGHTKVVIIDSIAAVFRLDSTTSIQAASTRSQAMFHLANCMKILSAQYHVIFIVTNQVTGTFSEKEIMQHSNLKPALGLSWSNCVNQRFMISKCMGNTGERKFQVLFSPYLPRDETAFFQITAEGVQDIC